MGGHVPTLPALLTPTDDVENVHDFSSVVGYPIMIKAVDGGGGRGIRLVSRQKDLSSLMARAIEESPSRQVFAEKAAANGFRHVEVQIAGDLHGNITPVSGSTYTEIRSKRLIIASYGSANARSSVAIKKWWKWRLAQLQTGS